MKYHGLGNDFLVLVDWERRVRFDASLARAACDRHRGLGADGLLRLSAPLGAGAVHMEVRNADGSVAETSGNGLRCAALAAVHEGLVSGPELGIETLAGISSVRVALADAPGGAEVRVQIAPMVVGPELAASGLSLGERAVGLPGGPGAPAALGDRRARRVSIGNPHLVIYGTGPDAAAPLPIDLAWLGPALEAGVPGGVNVEVVTAPGRDKLVLEVWERGAGLTLACGTGSCAAAAACRAAGLVGDSVEVANPGGTLHVELSGELLAPSAVLTGPAQRIARASLEDAAPVLAAGSSRGAEGRG